MASTSARWSQSAVEQHEVLDAALTPFLARSAALLDPVEHAVLLVAAVELRATEACHSAW